MADEIVINEAPAEPTIIEEEEVPSWLTGLSAVVSSLQLAVQEIREERIAQQRTQAEFTEQLMQSHQSMTAQLAEGQRQALADVTSLTRQALEQQQTPAPAVIVESPSNAVEGVPVEVVMPTAAEVQQAPVSESPQQRKRRRL